MLSLAGAPAVRLLGLALQSPSSQLQELLLHTCNITDEGGEELLFGALGAANVGGGVTSLDLSSNYLGRRSCVALGRLLVCPSTSHAVTYSLTPVRFLLILRSSW